MDDTGIVIIVGCIEDLLSIFGSATGLSPQTGERAKHALDRIQDTLEPIVQGYVSALAKAESDAIQGVNVSLIVADMRFARTHFSVGRDEIDAQIAVASKSGLPANLMSYFDSLKSVFQPDGTLTQRTTMFSSFLEAMSVLEGSNSFPDAEFAARTLREAMQGNWREHIKRYHALLAVIETEKFG
ncbi:hypothetical protein [Devosia sp. 919]|uniref:hypothetical protein n=1 Tax=Devosia sp. 919 TaxID=2726065 RepID=UPI001557ACF9|nr:hypothetical protein [Devosia sp. 919]